MDDELKGAFSLSKEEWLVLAFGLGASSIFGFPTLNTPINREDIIKALNSLTNRHFLEPEGDHFLVLTPYREAVLRTTSGKGVFFRSRNDMLPDFFCFSGEPLLLCEPMPQKNDSFRFEFTNIEKLWESLLSAGYFSEPEAVAADEVDFEILSETEDEVLFDVKKNKKLDAFSPVVFWAELRESEKNVVGFYSIIEHPLFKYILVEKKGERDRWVFDRTTATREGFFSFIGGAK